jgi:hypothetical protein
MKVIFTTTSGSQYLLDRKRMTWQRVRRSTRSGEIRREEGKLVAWPEVRCGQRVLLQDTSVLEGCVAHAVETTPVATMREIP